MASKSQKRDAFCPLEPVHKRLEDLHYQWHAAEAAYFDPDGFRMAIQTAIQTSRTVSFILQSNKAVIPDFDGWYERWQEKFRADALMRWMVDARNRIEKRGDLEAHSFVRADIVASFLNEGPSAQVPSELFDAPLKLVKSIPDNALGKHIKKDGIIRIQRRWIENTLPDYELLDAVAIAYGNLSLMLDDAHRQIGLPVPEARDVKTGEIYDKISMKGRMPCMIGHSDLRTLDVWLADGRPVEFERVIKKVSIQDLEKSSGRYDLDPSEIFGAPGTVNSPETILRSLFATARVMFDKDGYHSTIMFFFKGTKLIEFTELRLDEHGQKYLLMRNLAHDVVRRGADTVILLGEIWRSVFDPSDPYRRSVDAPDREEGLTGTLVSKSGEPLQIFARIRRDGAKCWLEPNEEHASGAQFMFAPFYEAWGREIPIAWMDQEKALRRGDGGEVA
ncbi:hypothetical protein ELI51_19830 [Rhizobium leguminosarum]|uniref:hypothetical protein n=1 Tax=Rhizobium leguminosarum TaxID=384 RepID=UPI0010302D67|nr:hypothetical protein [Rhizobium leguminosarum]TAU22557.1 hypothetical protein ELI50_19105 [Rhizobium leguminosarum]TAU42553.1 hypothetical protein ELI51_19830 [Rhizobium leguminosarum]